MHSTFRTIIVSLFSSLSPLSVHRLIYTVQIQLKNFYFYGVAQELEVTYEFHFVCECMQNYRVESSKFAYSFDHCATLQYIPVLFSLRNWLHWSYLNQFKKKANEEEKPLPIPMCAFTWILRSRWSSFKMTHLRRAKEDKKTLKIPTDKRRMNQCYFMTTKKKWKG